MGSEPLPRHNIAQAFFLLGHIPNVIALRIHNHIFIRLFEATESLVCQSGGNKPGDSMSRALTSLHSSFQAGAARQVQNSPTHL